MGLFTRKGAQKPHDGLHKIDWFGITSLDADKLFALPSTRATLDKVLRIQEQARRTPQAVDRDHA